MYYVYYRNVQSGNEYYVNSYDTEREAALKIASLIKNDWSLNAQGDCYYFIKKH